MSRDVSISSYASNHAVVTPETSDSKDDSKSKDTSKNGDIQKPKS